MPVTLRFVISHVTKILDSVCGPGLRFRLVLCAVLLILLGWGLGSVNAATPKYTHAEILHAIRMVESSGMDTPPDGDGGRAIGPYQIHRIYWIDSKVKGRYEQCRLRSYAERVIRNYMLRYVPQAWRKRDAETIARTHNGGPKGAKKKATIKYWKRVLEKLRAAREAARNAS